MHSGRLKRSLCQVKMGDGGLEYYVKLPPPNSKPFFKCSARDGEDYDILNDSSLPVVVLLGWAGCRDRNLSKYSAIYEQRGCITLRTTAPVPALFWRRSLMRTVARSLVALLSDLGLKEHPIFFHAFSNGGAFLYQHISEELRRSGVDFKVLGLILDSAPGERRFFSLLLALQAIVGTSAGCSEVGAGGGSLWRRITTAIVAALLSVALTAFWIVEAAFGAPLDRLQPLREEEPRWPQLLLYSDVDPLVLAQDVEHYAEMRRAKGANLEMIRFDGSPHVQHLIVHREKYITAVVAFMRKQLLSAKPESINN